MPRMLSKAECEVLAADKFCRLLPGTACVLRKNPEPAADFTICANGLTVHVELAQYREQGPYNELAEADWAFQRCFNCRWRPDPEVNECSVIVEYRKKGAYFVIPPVSTARYRADVDKIIAELKGFIKDHGRQSAARGPMIHFAPRAKADRYNRWNPRRFYVPSEDYPVLSDRFVALGMQYHPGMHFGALTTSMSCRFSGTDWKELERVIANKKANAPKYRAASNGSPVWLLLYSEGWPSTAQLSGFEVMPEVTREFLARVARAVGGAFDAAWWGNDLLGSGATLHDLPAIPAPC